MARTGVAVDPTLAAYRPFVFMGRDSAEVASRQRVYDVQIELARRFHKAGIVLLAGSDFAYHDYDVVPGRALRQEMEVLREAGLSAEEVQRAAGANITEWLRRRPPQRLR